MSPLFKRGHTFGYHKFEGRKSPLFYLPFATLGWCKPFPLFLALKHIRRRALQSGLTVLGVAVGVMVLITALSLTNGFISELIRSTLRATPHVTLSSYSADTFSEQDALLAQLQSHSEVVAVSPFISTQALIARRADATVGRGGRQGYTQILGIDPALEQQVLADLPVIGQQAQALTEQDGIVLGSTLYRNLNVLPGDEVLVQNIGSQRQTFVVADSFRVGNEFIDNLVSFTSIPTLQDFLNAPGEISGYHVRLSDPERARSCWARPRAANGLAGAVLAKPV